MSRRRWSARFVRVLPDQRSGDLVFYIPPPSTFVFAPLDEPRSFAAAASGLSLRLGHARSRRIGPEAADLGPHRSSEWQWHALSPSSRRSSEAQATEYRLSMDDELAAELARMAAEDQRMRRPRKGSTRTFVRRLDPKAAMEYRRIDTQNTERLRQILAEYGWPGKSLVGEQGAHDAWLIAQHADHDPAFQRQALELLAEAAAHGEAKPRGLAYLTDRVRVNEGREQVFGTQMRPDENGLPIPAPIEDREGLDERRAEVGLEPFEQYVRGFEEEFGSKGRP